MLARWSADAVDDGSFKTDPEIKTNCVRVYYNDGPHVDIPVYRSITDGFGNDKYELASVDWKESDPEGVNRWFREWVKSQGGGWHGALARTDPTAQGHLQEPALVHHAAQRLRTHGAGPGILSVVPTGASTSNCGSSSRPSIVDSRTTWPSRILSCLENG